MKFALTELKVLVFALIVVLAVYIYLIVKWLF